MNNRSCVQLRHASHYLDVLKRAGDLYDKGGEESTKALTLYNSNSDNITSGQLWTAANSDNDSKASVLCIEYGIAAPELLDLLKHPKDIIKWSAAALSAAKRSGDLFAEAAILNNLAGAHIHSGELLQAVQFSEDALAISRDLANQRIERDSLTILSLVHDALGESHRVFELSIQALTISQEIGDLKGEVIGLGSLGQAYYLRKDYRRAMKLFEEGLRIAQSMKNSRGVIVSLNNIGRAQSALGEYQVAIESFKEALALARELFDRRNEFLTLSNIGQTFHLLGDTRNAVSHYQHALCFARELADRQAEGSLLASLGDAFIDLGEFHRAIEIHKGRLELMGDANDQPTVPQGESMRSVSPTGPELSIAKTTARQSAKHRYDKDAPFTTSVSRFVTWLHLSDLHFRELEAVDQDIVISTLVEDVDQMVHKEGLNPDFIVFTGDLAFQAKPSEYLLARKFFDRLLGVTGLSNKELFIVPGNHDVDRNLILFATKTLSKSFDNREIANMILASPSERALFLQRFKGYSEFFNEYFNTHLSFDNDHYYYTQELEIDGTRLAILGLNSAWLAESDEDEMRRLVIGERQARGALDRVENADFKIALLHHPFDWIRGFDKNESVRLLWAKCDFILHGHLHEPSTTFMRSPDGSAIVIAGGACYDTRRYPNSYNFVRIDFRSKIGRIYFRGYSDKQPGFWAKDTMLYKNAPDGVYEFPLAQQ